MKTIMVSKIAGTNMEGLDTSIFNVIPVKGSVRLNFVFSNGSTATTSAVEFALQSASDTILFITNSGSRYAVQFEKEEELKNSSLADAIRQTSAISSLRFTDIGKKILEN